MSQSDRTPFYAHLATFGGMTRDNPELQRLSKATGFSVEHLFKVATGQRLASTRLALAVARNTPRNREVTADSFHVTP